MVVMYLNLLNVYHLRYANRLQGNLTWLAAAADHSRQGVGYSLHQYVMKLMFGLESK